MLAVAAVVVDVGDEGGGGGRVNGLGQECASAGGGCGVLVLPPLAQRLCIHCCSSCCSSSRYYCRCLSQDVIDATLTIVVVVVVL